MYNIPGHHHISMITKNVSENNHFYRDVLGLRRVKITVNQDDPSMYHLFYGDKTGSPGTELSFFEMPKVGHTHRGTNAITKIGLLVPSEESLIYWKARFEEHGVAHSDMTTYANHPALHFEDPEGLRMVLLVSNGAKVEHWETWEKSDVPTQHQIQGMGTVEMTVRRLDKLASTLTDMFGYTEISRSDEEAIFQSIEGEVFGEIVVKYLDGPREKPGRGSIHHLAIRVKNDTELSIGTHKYEHEASIHLASWIASILRVYISVNQTGFYLKSQPMDQASLSMEMISKHWVKNYFTTIFRKP